jgi:predicted permease
MSVFSLLVPDFSLILIGFLLMRYTDWGTPFWGGLEKMVYYLLFPALLFYSTSRTTFDFASTSKMAEVMLIGTFSSIALGWLGKPLFAAKPMVFESGVQTAFRFNSYVALAIASRLAGEEGTTLMALLIGIGVPICNIFAVHALARKSGGLAWQLAQNPLLIATIAGMLSNFLGLHIPEVVSATLSRLGSASIAMGLLTVGAGLRLSGLHEAKGLAAWFLAVKLVMLPAIVYAVGHWIGLEGTQFKILVVFSALPTATSAYVLATRMGGNGPFVAFLISASTVLSALTLPVWLLLVH